MGVALQVVHHPEEAEGTSANSPIHLVEKAQNVAHKIAGWKVVENWLVRAKPAVELQIQGFSREKHVRCAVRLAALPNRPLKKHEPVDAVRELLVHYDFPFHGFVRHQLSAWGLFGGGIQPRLHVGWKPGPPQMSYLKKLAVIRNGEIIIGFNSGSQSGTYLVFTDSSNSAYIRVLQTRKNWKRTPNVNEAHAQFVAVRPGAQMYRERCGGLGTVISHLPGEKNLTDYFHIYTLARARFGFETFRMFRLAYNLQREMLRFRLHLERINQLVAGVDVMAQSMAASKRQTPMAASITSANVNGNKAGKQDLGFSKGTALALDQEQINDGIWGRAAQQNQRPQSCAITIPRLENRMAGAIERWQGLEKARVARRSTITARAVSTSIWERAELLKSDVAASHSAMSLSASQLKASFQNKQSKSAGAVKQATPTHLQIETEPPEWKLTPYQYNSRNQWIINTQPPVSVHNVSEIPQSAKAPGVFALKECEFPFLVGRDPLEFVVYAAVTFEGDAYLYDRVFFQIEKKEEQGSLITQQLRTDKVFSAYDDQFQLSEKEVYAIFFSRKKGGRDVMIGLRKRLFELTTMLLGLVKGDFVRGVPSASSFGFYAFDYRLNDKDMSQLYVQKITAFPDLQLSSAYDYAYVPQLLDDLFDIVLDKRYRCERQPFTKRPVYQRYKEEFLQQQPIDAEAQYGLDEAEVYKCIPKAERVVEGTRFTTGRQENAFRAVFKHWEPVQAEAIL